MKENQFFTPAKRFVGGLGLLFLASCGRSPDDHDVQALVRRALVAAQPIRVGTTVPWDYDGDNEFGLATLRKAPEPGQCPEFYLKVVQPKGEYSDTNSAPVQFCGIKTLPAQPDEGAPASYRALERPLQYRYRAPT